MIPMIYGALCATMIPDSIGCTLGASARWRAANSIAFPNLLELFDSKKYAGADAGLKSVLLGDVFRNFCSCHLKRQN
jgi:hypothetical protein